MSAMDYIDYSAYHDEAVDLRGPHFRQDPSLMSAHDPFGQYNPFGAAHLNHLAVDVKPRLTKEQHDILEAHYQQQSKPNTQTKKGFAEALGVSLDKVNNWFQNRRAKSKQDAKKQAGQINIMSHAQQQQSHNLAINTHDISPSYLASEYFTAMNDSAVNVDPVQLSNGLGISQNDHAHLHSHIPADTMQHQLRQQHSHSHLQQQQSSQPQIQHHRQTSMHSMPSRTNTQDGQGRHRRTLTQEQFDAFTQNTPFVPAPTEEQHQLVQSPGVVDSNNDFLNDYFPELHDFTIDGQDDSNDPFTSEPMQSTFSNDSFMNAHSATTDPTTLDLGSRNASGQSSLSEWSNPSPPSVSITPAVQNPEPSPFDPIDEEISPHQKQGEWQPGQSVPVDYAQMAQDFAALRNQNGDDSRTQSTPFDQGYTLAPQESYHHRRQVSGSVQLAQAVSNLGISNDNQPPPVSVRTPSTSGGIAARRQRPRPMPLGAAALRSASYCGQLPASPSALPNNGSNSSNNTNSLAPGPQTLRRIKSSNVMNGIASGRIQKPQRSPLNLTFADAANSPRFARRVSSYSPSRQPTSAGLAPPLTPLSPGEVSGRLDMSRNWLSGHNSRQQSISEESAQNGQSGLMPSGMVPSNGFSSPPTTPMYAHQFARGRMMQGQLAENTPPQSAPATQQSFSSAMYNQMGQMQQQSVPVLQSHPQSYMSMQSNEYPQMQNMGMSMQQLQVTSPDQYMDNMGMHQFSNDSSMHMVPSSGSMQSSNGYASSMQFGQPSMNMNNMQQNNNHGQYSFVPSSPGILMSQNHVLPTNASSVSPDQHMINKGADFFVHEYNPPRETKRSITPRKPTESGPKSYTFANHGPEHFEKGAKNKEKDVSSSPSSSLSGSTSS